VGRFQWLDEAVQALLSTLFPADCRICRTPLTRVSRLPVCNACLDSIHRPDCQTCARCGERLESQFAEGLCGMCRRMEPHFVRASAYGAYDGGLRDLIHLLKYEHVRPVAGILGRMLAEAIEDMRPGFSDQCGPAGCTGDTPVAHTPVPHTPVPRRSSLPVMVPVPLHRSRLRERGFNQSEEIARAAAKLLPEFEVSTRVLARKRPTESQIGLTRHQRRANLRGAFAVIGPEFIAARDVLLVDDVFTTGTTVSECARILLRCGASRVFVVTVARVLKDAPALDQLSREEHAVALGATA
jgi:ComF family protein